MGSPGETSRSPTEDEYSGTRCGWQALGSIVGVVHVQI